MNSVMIGALIGMICGLVWIFSSFSGVLLVLGLGIVGALVGAAVTKFGGLRNLISQLVSEE